MQSLRMPRQHIAPPGCIEPINRINKCHFVDPITPCERTKMQALVVQGHAQHTLQHAGDHEGPVIFETVLTQHLLHDVAVPGG